MLLESKKKSYNTEKCRAWLFNFIYLATDFRYNQVCYKLVGISRVFSCVETSVLWHHDKLANTCTKIPLQYSSKTIICEQISWETTFQHLCCFFQAWTVSVIQHNRVKVVTSVFIFSLAVETLQCVRPHWFMFSTSLCLFGGFVAEGNFYIFNLGKILPEWTLPDSLCCFSLIL